MKEARQRNNTLHKLIFHFNFSELQTMWQSLTMWSKKSDWKVKSCLVTSCFPNYNPGHNILELYNVLVRLIQDNSTWFLSQKTLFTNCFKSCRTTSYSQTCSNDHLYQTTTRLRESTLSPTKPILIQLFLYKTSTCLTRPVNTFFVPQMKKESAKTTTAILYPAKDWHAMHIKSTFPWLYSFSCYFIMVYQDWRPLAPRLQKIIANLKSCLEKYLVY